MESVLDVVRTRPPPTSFPMFIAEVMEIIEMKKIKNKLGCLVAVAEVTSEEVPPSLAVLLRDKVLIHDMAAVLTRKNSCLNVRTFGCLSQ